MRTSKCIMLMLAVLTLALSLTTFGQSDRGAINGTVTDPSGAAVSGAVIKVTNRNSGETREMSTTGEGHFTVPELRADLYSLKVKAPGFKTATVDDIQVAVQVARRVDVKLEVGESARR